ncbi:polysaccharide pyruvyl transferase family protein [Oceanimonas sp. CHS3-5]|uniref:polysaccharide pyruvyl transferase family protein n=1 Tax=Oceanimonas sp. CHS3-5 TaxID=3068186 RepID=UPI00273F0596|nr:polysaccharide pyruvyl transferase family protein [Oceanimonas sp. CHS3-5]MDP5291626.1 polysaccharide pyruvyl transferase family protein [Oceanimonas sp. CHS3-5]
MIIEIRRAGFINKGAELMLHAVVQRLRERYPEAKLTMAPIYGGADDTFDKMLKLNLYPKAWFWRKGIDFTQFIPNRLLKAYGLVTTNEIDIVIDAAGFSYSDQWGPASSRELSASSKKWKKNGTKLIMLPQAFGPYEKSNIIKYVKIWAENADLIFPREKDSYRYLTQLVGEKEKIKLYPDFTNLVKGTFPHGYDPTDKRIAIVPNYRMVDKTDLKTSQAYLPFLIKVVKYLVDRGLQPFLLVHEGKNDQILADKVSYAVGSVPIVKETDPLHIKGILGTCDATIGSRFHGLVSALSQGVPSLATGWSHKYQRLFEDYGFIEGLISVNDDDVVLYKKIDLLINPESSKPLCALLAKKSNELKELSEEMWERVFSVIDSVGPR